MSRIDEAWKQVSRGRPTRSLRARELERVVPIADELTIDQYMRESAGELGADDLAPTRPPVSSVPPPAVSPAAARIDVEPNERLVVGIERNAVSLEQYRRLAATLHESQDERGLKSVMVTSAVQGEGKTLTITNLALTLSESYGRRVLLIDGDFRRPSIHQVLGIPREPVVSDFVRGDVATPPYVEVSPLLTVLAAGSPGPNPQALLSSERLRALVNDATSRFDWVLFDASPIGTVSDAQILARFAQTVVLVIRAGSTSANLVRRTVEIIGHDRIIGTVLNAVDEGLVRDGSYYHDDEYAG